MKLPDVLILSLALAAAVVGIHQSTVSGVGASYPIFMFAVALLFWFQLRRNKTADMSDKKAKDQPKKKNKR